MPFQARGHRSRLNRSQFRENFQQGKVSRWYWCDVWETCSRIVAKLFPLIFTVAKVSSPSKIRTALARKGARSAPKVVLYVHDFPPTYSVLSSSIPMEGSGILLFSARIPSVAQRCIYSSFCIRSRCTTVGNFCTWYQKSSEESFCRKLYPCLGSRFVSLKFIRTEMSPMIMVWTVLGRNLGEAESEEEKDSRDEKWVYRTTNEKVGSC